MGSVGELDREDRSPEEVAALREAVVGELRRIAGERWVTADPHILDTYTWQYIAELSTGTNYMERPLAVVLPETTEQVAEAMTEVWEPAPTMCVLRPTLKSSVCSWFPVT